MPRTLANAMRHTVTLVAATLLALLVARPAAAVPQSVAELWSDFDPRKEPLEVQVVRQWKQDGGVYRCVCYLIGTFKGKPARMAAFYGFPENAKGKLPAVMHMHGGGQRAFLEEVRTYVGRGYAALSVNWGGREMEDARPGDPATDWGAVDPTQQNVPGYFNLLPGDKFLVDHESPKNCNWYLLTLGCRRGITFLEQQPEVDASRIGVYGHSMGGNLTMYVAGTDTRIKAAAPSCGGQGFRTERHEMLGGHCQQEHIKGDAALFTRTMGFEHYAPLIRCPVVHLSATNDFHGWMDDVYRTNVLIPEQPLRYAFSPHLNHRFIPEAAIARPLGLDHYLKGGPALPETPRTDWQLNPGDGVPVMRVMPDKTSLPVARVEIYYSVDPDPRARFWRGATTQTTGDAWMAKLPVLSTEQPLYAFANVYYTLPRAESLPHMSAIREVCLSSLLHRASAAELKSAGAHGTDQPSLIIDDFTRGWHDWYRLNAGNRDYWQNWTRKIADPKWLGPDGARLKITLRLPQSNHMTFVAIENEWRSYRGPKRVFICERQIAGQPQVQTITLDVADFKDAKGAALANWRQIDQFGICAHWEEKDSGRQSQPRRWNGELPEFHRLEWAVACFGQQPANNNPDLLTIAPDLENPVISTGNPAPGKQVVQSLPAYAGTEVAHTLYLPTDWSPGKRFPVFIEYHGNTRRVTGRDGLGYGLSGGKGFIWAVLPYVGPDHKSDVAVWWGDVEATVAYAKEAVPAICRRWGGDPAQVILIGHSRGAIACNYIGLHDDQIARLWQAMIAVSHYDDGHVAWGMTPKDQQRAAPHLHLAAPEETIEGKPLQTPQP